MKGVRTVSNSNLFASLQAGGTPKSSAPAPSTPEASSPETNSPEPSSPEASAPAPSTPAPSSSEANSPEANSPEANSPEANSPEPSSPEASSPEANLPEANSPAPSASTPNTPQSDMPRPSNQNRQPDSNNTIPNPTIPIPNGRTKPKADILNAGKTILGRYTAPLLRRTAGLFLGGAGAIVGVSAGIAQGDMGKAVTGLFVGAKAGNYTGQKAVDGIKKVKDIPDKAHSVADTFREGAYGEEKAQNIKFDREFRKSSGYKTLKRNNPNFSDDKIQKMLDAGITDYKKMDKILKNSAKHPRKYTMDKAIAYHTLAEKCPDGILYDNKKFIRYCQDKKINISPQDVANLRKNIIDFK